MSNNLFGALMLKFKKLSPKASAPTYGTPGAACFDIATTDNVTLLSGRSHVYKTGIAVEVPEGYALLIYSRSGMGFNKDTRLSNCVGVIDSDFKGEVLVKLRNDGKEVVNVRAGDRIAQGMLVKIDQWQFEEVLELSESQRGANGIGSTGA